MEYRTWSLDRWVGMFKEIYGEQNKTKNDEQLWLNVVRKAGGLAEDFRKQHIKPRKDENGDPVGLLANAPGVFAWLSAFTTRYGSLEEMTWNKFPNSCPYCLKEIDCSCYERKPDIGIEEREKVLEPRRADKQNNPRTLYGWQIMFDRIYGKANRAQTIEQVGYHLMEEISEVAKAILVNDKAELKKEAVDVFAWLIGTIVKCNGSIGENHRLDDLIWERYPNQCPRCGLSPCGCIPNQH